MEHNYIRLDWDTNFFNYNVGKVTGSLKSEKDLINIRKLIKENNSVLTYYSSPQKLDDFVFEDKGLQFILVDKKTTYFKRINPKLNISKSVSTVDRNLSTDKLDKLINLAIQSGVYSRFSIDKRIGNKKFREMYSLWMINSINHTIAKEVLIFVENNEIAGFVTLGEKNNRADIGIIAVDTVFRGKGIGKTLMESAEKWFSKNDYKSIQVVTQGDNIPACKLYESCGYKIDTVEYFYHIWNKDYTQQKM